MVNKNFLFKTVDGYIISDGYAINLPEDFHSVMKLAIVGGDVPLFNSGLLQTKWYKLSGSQIIVSYLGDFWLVYS